MTRRPILLPVLAALLCPLTATAAPSEAAQSARDAAREYGAAVRNCDLAWALDFMYPPVRRTLADRLANRDPRREAESARRVMGIERESEDEARRRMKAADDALRTQYRKMGERMKSQGLVIEKFSVGEPYSEYAVSTSAAMVRPVLKDRDGKVQADSIQADADRSRIVVLPTILVVKVPVGRGEFRRLERRDYIYAIRDEVISSPVNYRGTKLNKWYFVDSNTDVNTLRAYFPALPLDIDVPPVGDRPLD